MAAKKAVTGAASAAAAAASPALDATKPARGEGARISGRSRTPWTHELVDGSTRSYLRGSLRMRRQRARGPNERACNAGGVLGKCGAERRGQGRGREGAARAKGGRKAAHACGVAPICARGRCARARAGVGGARAPPDSILPTLPVAHQVNLRRKLALRFGARAPALTPQTVAPDRALGLGGLSHRLRARRALPTAGRPVWAKARQRRSRERRGQLFRTCARAGTPGLLVRRSAATARF